MSVITNISFDHLQLLGDRLALIAREKAGIIKPGRPVVTTAEAPEALAVIEQVAKEHRAPLAALGRDFHYECIPGIQGTRESAAGDHRPRFRVKTSQQDWPWMELGLFGQHQAANAAGVIAVVEHLRQLGLPIDASAVSRGLAGVVWPARLEVVGARPLILLDCAHNVASAQALVDTIRESFAVIGEKAIDSGCLQRQASGRNDARPRPVFRPLLPDLLRQQSALRAAGKGSRTPAGRLSGSEPVIAPAGERRPANCPVRVGSRRSDRHQRIRLPGRRTSALWCRPDRSIAGAWRVVGDRLQMSP